MGLVTLAVGKAELDIGTGDASEDDRVNKAIDAASDWAERYCNRKFVSQTHTHYFDGNDSRYLLLREFPVASITNAWIDDQWNFSSPLASAEYRVLQDVMLVRKCGLFQYTNALNTKVTYVAGYTTIPSDIQQAVLEMMKFIYYTRNDRRMGLGSKTKLGESVSYETDLPPLAKALLEGHRRAVYLADRLAIFPPEMVKRLSDGGTNGKG